MKAKGPQPKPEPAPKKEKKPLKRTGVKKKKASDSKLWKWFSTFIRLRDVNEDGIGKCFTCKTPLHWKRGDCGHGVGRQHNGTKYNEKNNHLQCKKCNGFEEGRKDLYKEEMDRRYGAGTWDMMQMSRNGKKPSTYEILVFTEHYKKLAEELAKEKGQEL